MVGHRRVITMLNVVSVAGQAITTLAACFSNVKCTALFATQQADDRGGGAGIMVCYLKSLPVRQFDPSSVLNGGAGEGVGCVTRVSGSG